VTRRATNSSDSQLCSSGTQHDLNRGSATVNEYNKHTSPMAYNRIERWMDEDDDSLWDPESGYSNTPYEIIITPPNAEPSLVAVFEILKNYDLYASIPTSWSSESLESFDSSNI